MGHPALRMLDAMARERAMNETRDWINELFELGWTEDEVRELVDETIEDREDR